MKKKLPTIKQLAIMYPGELSTLASEINGLIGIDATISIFNHFEGNSLYICTLRSAFRKCVKRFYNDNKNDITIREFANYYGYTIRQINNL